NTSAALDGAQRAGDEVRRRVADAVGERSVDDEAVAVGVELERVDQVDGGELGIEQVVPVGTRAGDTQRQRQLGWRAQDLAHAASLPHATTSSSSARAVGATPAAA